MLGIYGSKFLRFFLVVLSKQKKMRFNHQLGRQPQANNLSHSILKLETQKIIIIYIRTAYQQILCSFLMLPPPLFTLLIFIIDICDVQLNYDSICHSIYFDSFWRRRAIKIGICYFL